MQDEEGKLSREAGFLPDVEKLSTPETADDVFEVGEQDEPAKGAPDMLPEARLVAQEMNKVVQPHPEKEPLLARVEKVLESGQGIAEVYRELSDEKKAAFRVAGETAAKKIREMIASGKPRRYQIMKLVREWLSVVPKANRAWIEQSASVEADAIEMLAEEHRNAA